MTSPLSSPTSAPAPAPITFLTRFRHTSGDILLPCSPTARISELKEKLCAAWPKDGPLAAEAPAQPDEIRFIALGRFVADRDTLFPVEGASTSGGGERGASAETSAAPAAPSLRPPRGAALPGPPASASASAPADEGSGLARHPPPTLHVVIRRNGEGKGGGGTGGKGGGKGGSGQGEGGREGGGSCCGCCSCAVQ